jgi:hypothetical protein
MLMFSASRSSEPGCKGSNLFFIRNIYFKINPALLLTMPSFQPALSSEPGCKSRKK